MNAKPTLASPHVARTIVAAALAAVIAIGLLNAVSRLFQRDGAPFERLVAAERACVHCAFESERKTCVGSYLAASRARIQNIASR